MRSSTVVGIAVVVLLLCGGWRFPVGKRLATSRVSNAVSEMATQGSGVATAFSRYAAIVSLAIGLQFVAGQLPALAQHPVVTWASPFSHDVYHSIFALTRIAENGDIMALPVLYIGDDTKGTNYFAGFYLYPLDRIEGELHLYGTNLYGIRREDRLIAANIEKTTVDIILDPFRDFNDIHIFTIDGLDLHATRPDGGSYIPVVLGDYSKLEVGAELDMLQYQVVGGAPRLFQKAERCEVINPLGWDLLGGGLHNCAPLAPSSSRGTPIHSEADGVHVGFYGEHVRGGHLLTRNPDFNADYVNALLSGTTLTAVDSRDKLPTTWGALKAGQ